MAHWVAACVGRFVSLGAGLTAACSSAPAGVPGCRTSAPLFEASGTESYLGLGAEQTRAIVALVDDADPDRVRCSGTFIAPDWVLTAGHCLGSGALRVHLPGDGDAPDSVLAVITGVAHPYLDVGLVQVDRSTEAQAATELVPLGLLRDAGEELVPGTLLELAGYGLTESGTSAGLEFLTEPVVALDAESVTVDGLGSSGACSGDSGGPLLLRDHAGTVAVAGVLSLGSVSCRDRDTYARLDGSADFIEAVTGPLPPPPLDCGTIDVKGRCLYGNALWCDDGALVADACAEPERCGWDDEALGFRCVRAASDACL